MYSKKKGSRSRSRSKSKSKSQSMNEQEIHGYSTVVGRIPSIVNNSSDMTKVMNGMKRIESMIIAITAEWCGACQRIKKQLHTALNTNRSGIVATNIDLDVLNKNPIVTPPSAVPSIGLYVNGKMVKEMSVDQLAEVLKTPKKNVKNNSKNSNNSTKSVRQTLVSANDEEAPSVPGNSASPFASASAMNPPSPFDSASAMNPVSPSASMNPVSPSASANQTSMSANAMSTGSPILPPSAASDQSPTSVNTSPKNSQAGGDLYSALASTTYQLAAPAILLGIANATLGSRKRRSKKTKRTRKGKGAF